MKTYPNKARYIVNGKMLVRFEDIQIYWKPLLNNVNELARTCGTCGKWVLGGRALHQRCRQINGSVLVVPSGVDPPFDCEIEIKPHMK